MNQCITPNCEESIDDTRVCSEHGEVDLYIKLREDSKKPAEAFDGWPIDPDHPGVYSEEYVENSDWEYWALVADAERNRLVLDVDRYKMHDPQGIDARMEYESTRVDASPRDGLHVHIDIVDPSITRDELRDHLEAIDHVELKGPMARGYTAHTTYPGYDTIIDEEPREFEDLETLAEDFPVVEYDPEPESETPSPAHDGVEYEPTRNREEVREIGTTDDITVIFDAIAHVEPRDIVLRSQQTEDGGERKSWDPVWTNSDSGTRLGWDRDIGWINRATGGTDALAVVAAEEGIIRETDEYPSGEDFWRAVDELRKRGADVPEYERGGLEICLDESDIRRARRQDDTEVSRLRKRFRFEAETAIADGMSGIIAGPTAINKTGFAIETAEDRRVFLATGTQDNYAEIEDRAAKRDVSTAVLPSFPRDCSLMDPGNPWYERAKHLYYERDVKPRDIIDRAPDEHIADDDEYRRKLDTDWDDVDLLIGYPTHTHLPGATEGRVVILDDVDPQEAFVDTFTTEYIRPGVNELLDRIESRYDDVEAVLQDGEYGIIEFEIQQWLAGTDDADDLLESRMHIDESIDPGGIVDRTTYCSANILDQLRLLCDGFGSWDTEDYHAAGTWGGRFDGDWWLATLPDLEAARQVLVMAAYPAIDEARAFLERTGVGHEGIRGLDDYADWYRALNVVAVQLSEHQRSMNYDPAKAPGRAARDAERHEAIVDAFDPDFVTSTKRGLSQMDVEQPTGNFNGLRGLNERRDAESVYVGGTGHSGDIAIGLRAQFAGVENPEVSRDGDGPSEWSNEITQRIHQRELERHPHEAITRVGRDSSDLTIAYVDTSCIPDWFETIDATDAIQRLSTGERGVLDAIDESDGPLRAREISEVVEVSRRQVYNCLDRLVERGVVENAEATGAYNAAMFEGGSQPVKSRLMIYSKAEFHRFSRTPGSNPWWSADDASGPADTSPTSEQITLDAGLDPPP